MQLQHAALVHDGRQLEVAVCPPLKAVLQDGHAELLHGHGRKHLLLHVRAPDFAEGLQLAAHVHHILRVAEDRPLEDALLRQLRFLIAAAEAQQQEHRQRAGLRQQEQQPEALQPQGIAHERQRDEQHRAAQRLQQERRLLILAGLIVIAQQDIDAGEQRPRTVEPQRGTRQRLRRRTGDAEQQAHSRGPQLHKGDQRAAHRQSRREAETHRVPHSLPVVLALIGGEDGLHGAPRPLKQVQDQVGGVLNDVEHRHRRFAAQADQQIVAHEEEDHLVQILHRGGHTRLQRGKGRDEPAPARQREAQRVLLTEKARQIDGDGDDLSQRGGQRRAPRAHVQRQHQRDVQRDVAKVAYDRAGASSALTPVVAQIVVEHVGQVEQRRGRDKDLQIVPCGGIQRAVCAPRAQQRQQRVHEHAAQHGGRDAEKQRQREHTVKAVRGLLRFALTQQTGIANGAAQSKAVGKHAVDHVDRQDQTDGGKSHGAQPLPHHHGVRHIAQRPAERREHGRDPQSTEHPSGKAVRRPMCGGTHRPHGVTQWSECRRSRSPQKSPSPTRSHG